MYSSFFGLRENPFNLTPDPRYLFPSQYHKEALEILLDAISKRKGLITVTGDIGTGKTTLCRVLLNELDSSTKSALVFNSFISDMELLVTISQEFAAERRSKAKTKIDYLASLKSFLLGTFRRGANAVLLIDEAQNLSPGVLRQILRLCELEAAGEKLIQVILVGQSELSGVLAVPSSKPLSERIKASYYLKPLEPDDIGSYIEHRLGVAGAQGRVRFTEGASRKIYRYSEGIPRRINAVCDRALLIAYVKEKHKITKEMIETAIKELYAEVEPKAAGFTGWALKRLTKRFASYQRASWHLTGLRFETDDGKFDPREHRKSRTLEFENLATQWLKTKEKEVKKSSFQKISNHLYKASKFWGNIKIKEIGFNEIQLFFLSLEGLSEKTKYNHLSSLRQFFRWLKRAGITDGVPEFPEVKFELAWRKTVDKETQQSIIEEVNRISSHINPKIWIGIKWLSTYFNLRPSELLNIREGDIDLKQGEIFIPHPKEKRPKIVYLLDEDVELLQSFPRGLPDLFFFRHVKGISGVKAGQRFGDKYLYKWWKKACGNLGIEDVDLYGGTRHSTVRELRKYRSPEEIRLGSMHSTNKAFERYYRADAEDYRSIYRDAQGGNETKFRKRNPRK
jgi:type II secretory pathway predicted ATPase ExeA/integrase